MYTNETTNRLIRSSVIDASRHADETLRDSRAMLEQAGDVYGPSALAFRIADPFAYHPTSLPVHDDLFSQHLEWLLPWSESEERVSLYVSDVVSVHSVFPSSLYSESQRQNPEIHSGKPVQVKPSRLPESVAIAQALARPENVQNRAFYSQAKTLHKPDCARAFSNYDSSCPRCIELMNGAKPRKGWTR